jgi:golgi-specific brefeldin A-resistance guanine nucleotide exchange factor 1
VAEHIVIGVGLIIKKHQHIIRLDPPPSSEILFNLFSRSQTEWNLVFALLSVTIAHPEASRQSFDLIVGLASDGPGQLVTADNFSGLIRLLDDFATAAGTFIESQQHHGRRNQPLNALKFVIPGVIVYPLLMRSQLTAH